MNDFGVDINILDLWRFIIRMLLRWQILSSGLRRYFFGVWTRKILLLMLVVGGISDRDTLA